MYTAKRKTISSRKHIIALLRRNSGIIIFGICLIGGLFFVSWANGNSVYDGSNTTTSYATTEMNVITSSNDVDAGVDIESVMKWNEGFLKDYGESHYNYLKSMNSTDITSNVIIDIGMKHGGECLAAVRYGMISYSFEPIPRNIEEILGHFDSHLRTEFVDATNLDEILTVIDCKKEWNKCNGDILIPPRRKHNIYGHCYVFIGAVSDKSSFEGAKISDSGHQSSLVQSEWERDRRDFKGIVTVPLIKIDDIVQNIDILWFKTDTQGNDYFVIKGAINLFQDNNVEMLNTEYDPKMFLAADIKPYHILNLLRIEAKMKQCNGNELSDEYIDSFNKWTLSHHKNNPEWWTDLKCTKH